MTLPPSLLDVVRMDFLHSFMFDMARYLIGAGLVAGAVWLLGRTSWAMRKIQRRKASRADFAREFGASVRTVLVFTVLAMPMVWAFQHGYLRTWSGTLTPLNYALYLAAMVLAHDTWFYWTHRAMHLPLLYRSFHRFHHLTITPTAWTAYSFAIPEAAVSFLYMPVWLALVPTPGPVVFAFLALMILRNTMGHAGLELHPRGWASHPVLKWISTTTHHDIHHGTSYNHNYGYYFTWWDKLMGTEHPDYVATFDRVTGRAPASGAAASGLPGSAIAPTQPLG